MPRARPPQKRGGAATEHRPHVGGGGSCVVWGGAYLAGVPFARVVRLRGAGAGVSAFAFGAA